jgi:hypothetical protein
VADAGLISAFQSFLILKQTFDRSHDPDKAECGWWLGLIICSFLRTSATWQALKL